MANTTSIQVMLDGPRNTVIKVEGVLDTSNLTPFTIADPATLVGIDNTGNLKAAKFRVDSVQHTIQDALVLNLIWDATTPVRMEQLTGRGYLRYHSFGGLFDNATPGNTGKILLSTQGWTAGQVLSFTLLIKLVKTQ